ncbi:MAG: hypothetical protein IKU03_05835 [Bacteroidales bacterium]|nr:hypothetical protein [Bacteroidales bacterium]
MKKYLLLTVLAFALMLSACNRHEGCEDLVGYEWLLPKTLNQYLPYTMGQRVSFVNETMDSPADTLVYEVSEVFLLEYDTAYSSYHWNPCYPTGLLPDYFVALKRVSEQNELDVPKHLRLVFSGSAGGDDGQNVDVQFFVVADFDHRQCILSSTSYNGDISNMGNEILLDSDDYDEMSHAHILKGKGLTGFVVKNGNVTWSLVE